MNKVNINENVMKFYQLLVIFLFLGCNQNGNLSVYNLTDKDIDIRIVDSDYIDFYNIGNKKIIIDKTKIKSKQYKLFSVVLTQARYPSFIPFAFSNSGNFEIYDAKNNCLIAKVCFISESGCSNTIAIKTHTTTKKARKTKCNARVVKKLY